MYEFHIYSWIYGATSIFALIFSLFLFVTKRSKVSLYISGVLISIAIWSGANIFEAAASTEDLKYFWSQISYFGITSVPAVFLLFSFRYASLTRFYGIKYLAVIFLIPATTLVLAFTNGYHHMIWRSVTINPITNLGQYDHGWFFWVEAIYSYILIILSIFIIITFVRKQHRIFTSQSLFITLGAIFPVIGNIMYLGNLNPVPNMDWTPVSFWISMLLLTIGITRYSLFELIPFARGELVQRMTMGYLVTDAELRVRDGNPMVARIFGLSDIAQVMGRCKIHSLQKQKKGDHRSSYYSG